MFRMVTMNGIQLSPTVVLVAVVACWSGSAFAQNTKVKLNEGAFTYAQQLITQGHIALDKRTEWGDHHPTGQNESDFIRDHGFAEYEKWHLGIDVTHAQKTKARYKFPFGDFKNIRRSALLAVKSRAHQFGYPDIENAAARLLQMMDSHR